MTIIEFTAISGVVIGILQCFLIWFGLKQMRVAANIRSKELENVSIQVESQSKALENMGLGIRELLERSDPK